MYGTIYNDSRHCVALSERIAKKGVGGQSLWWSTAGPDTSRARCRSECRLGDRGIVGYILRQQRTVNVTRTNTVTTGGCGASGQLPCL